MSDSVSGPLKRLMHTLSFHVASKTYYESDLNEHGTTDWLNIDASTTGEASAKTDAFPPRTRRNLRG